MHNHRHGTAAVLLGLALPLSALWLGFTLAFGVLATNTILLALLPLLAFALGYYAPSRASGGLSGFALFAGYTFATSLMWWGLDSPNLCYPLPYFYAFVVGGFSLVLLGAFAPALKAGLRARGARALLAGLAVVVLLCGFGGAPHYGYYYQVSLLASADPGELTIYLPISAQGEKPYTALLDRRWDALGGTTAGYAAEMVATEHGSMLKLTVSRLDPIRQPGFSYHANIILWQQEAPLRLLTLTPKYDVTAVDAALDAVYVGPFKTREHRVVERFKVPVKIEASEETHVRLTLWNRTDRASAINFAYGKNTTYTESIINYDGMADGQWALVPVEAVSRLEVMGVGD